MPNINDPYMNSQFESKLEQCEASFWKLTAWEQDFVRGLRSHYDSREAMEELGHDGWSPSVKQWNQLSSIAERVGGP